MMNTGLLIQPERWVLAFVGPGILLVLADLAWKPQATTRPGLMEQRTAIPVISQARHDPRFKRFKLDCGCTVDYADGMSPPCSIRFKDGSLMQFDHRYRASIAPVRSAGGGIMQFGYDEQDRVNHVRHDPCASVYYFEKDGSLKEIRHWDHGGRAEVLHPKYTIEKGGRTRYPHQLPHPHVLAETAMGHLLDGTWKAFER